MIDRGGRTENAQHTSNTIAKAGAQDRNEVREDRKSKTIAVGEQELSVLQETSTSSQHRVCKSEPSAAIETET